MIKKKKYLTFSNSSHSRNSIKLSLPESSKYSNYSEECRLVLDNYFKKNYKSFGDLHVENYLRKTVDIKILNHYALHQRLKNEHPDTENFSTRDNLIDRIIDENLPAKRSLLKYLLGGFIFLLAYVTRSIISSLSSSGIIFIDKGAASALQNGKSLLAAGITRVKGTFDKGENVLIIDNKGNQLARGLSSFKSSEIDKIKGKQSKEIEKILGYLGKSEIIHKDDMVKL